MEMRFHDQYSYIVFNYLVYYNFGNSDVHISQESANNAKNMANHLPSLGRKHLLCCHICVGLYLRVSYTIWRCSLRRVSGAN